MVTILTKNSKFKCNQNSSKSKLPNKKNKKIADHMILIIEELKFKKKMKQTKQNCESKITFI